MRGRATARDRVIRWRAARLRARISGGPQPLKEVTMQLMRSSSNPAVVAGRAREDRGTASA